MICLACLIARLTCKARAVEHQKLVFLAYLLGLAWLGLAWLGLLGSHGLLSSIAMLGSLGLLGLLACLACLLDPLGNRL